MRRSIVAGAAVLAGGVFGYLNTTQPRPALPFAVLLASGYALGLADPRRGWMWGAIVAAGASVGQLVAALTGYEMPFPNNFTQAIVVILPGIAAGIAGTLTRRGLTPDPPRESS